MKKILLTILCSAFLMIGCVDLEEEVFDEVQVSDVESLLENDPEFAANLVGAMYTPLVGLFGGQNMHMLMESSSDLSITPGRVRPNGSIDWLGDGQLIRMHTHEWNDSEAVLLAVWNNLQAGIASGLSVLTAFNTPAALEDPNITTLRAETQAMLAFYMWYIFDLYGQVPYIDIETEENQVLLGDEAIDEMLRLIDEAMPNLGGKADVNSIHLFSKAAAKMIKARIYLNKGVYNDRYAASYSFDNSDMTEVINITTDIIGNEGYALATDYFRLFDADSDGNSATNEIIFATNLIAGVQGLRELTAMVMSQGQYGGDAGGFRGWNGYCTLPEFAQSWDTDDPRYYEENYPNEPGTLAPEDYKLNRGIQIGQQYGPVPVDGNNTPSEPGTFRRDGNGDLIIEQLFNFPRDNFAINYTLEIGPSPIESNLFAGARIFKYEYDTPGPGRWDTNINPIVLRLADVYLMRAEARLRNGDDAGALSDINTVRAARGGDNLASVDLDAMLEERAFELYFESIRRTDLIRFGKFNDDWTLKGGVTPDHVRVFPIPINVITAAEGSIIQNQGYN